MWYTFYMSIQAKSESIRIDKTLVRKLRKLKAKEGRFLTWYVEQAIEQYLNERVTAHGESKQ